MTVQVDRLPQDYSKWEKDVSSRAGVSSLLFPTGCGGVVVHPRAISTEFRRRDLIKQLCPQADDIWLKAAYLKSGFSCRGTQYSFPCLEYPGTTESGLAQMNVDQGGNDEQLKKVFQYFDLRM